MQSNKRSISLDVCDYQEHPLCNLYDNALDVSGQATDVVVHTERNGFKEIQFSIPSKCFDADNMVDNYRLNFLVNDYKLRLKTKADDGTMETDWFLISESRVNHNAFSKNYDITASHISSLLNTKNLDLEFSDEEGNNTGTIEEIASTILEGTGWHLAYVAEFLEEDKYITDGEQKPKIRSFTASAKTGAFKMMNDLCELFDAKPIYHGEGVYQGYYVEGQNTSHQTAIYKNNLDYYEATLAIAKAEQDGWTDLLIKQGDTLTGRTVDIYPLNPFSEKLEEGDVPPEVFSGLKVFPLYYDKNVKSVARTLNSDSLVTKLAAYGSYGDLNGLCSLQTAVHSELTLEGPFEAGEEYYFVWSNTKYYFTPSYTVSDLHWSSLDYVSRSYMLDGDNLIKVYTEPQSLTNTKIENYTEEFVRNYFPFIMDFSYYQKIGMLTDDMLLYIAKYQTDIIQDYINAEYAQEAITKSEAELVHNSGFGSGFALLDVVSSEKKNGNVVLTLGDTYKDGVVYRSDWTYSRKNYFSWFTASGIKLNGEPIAGSGSVVYVVHKNSPTTWVKSYIKELGDGTDNYYRDEISNTYKLHEKISYATVNEFPVPPSAQDEKKIHIAEDTQYMYIWFTDRYVRLYADNYSFELSDYPTPTSITLWTSDNTWQEGDKVYIFSANDVAGLFGPREDQVSSNKDAIEQSTKRGSTEVHPIDFIYNDDPVPATTTVKKTYGWYYRSYTGVYSFGDLYFCWGENGDKQWEHVHVAFGSSYPDPPSDPRYEGSKYLYHIRLDKLYQTDGETWTEIEETTNEKYIKQQFGVVVSGCLNQEILMKGYKEQYYYQFADKEVLPQGNYAVKNEFHYFWLFSTDRDIDVTDNGQLRLYTSDRKVWQDNDKDHILPYVENSFNILDFPVSDELPGLSYVKGDFDENLPGIVATGNKLVSSSIHAHEDTDYQVYLPKGSIVVCMNTYGKYISHYVMQSNTLEFTAPHYTSIMKIVVASKPASRHYLRVKNFDTTLFFKDTKYTIVNMTSSGKRMGLPYLMDKFMDLADDIYLEKLPALKRAQAEITDKTTELAVYLGDMYREGYHQNSDYVDNDQQKLYADSLENLKEISHPQATYEVEFLDLYDSDKMAGLSEDAMLETVNWPDVDISYAAHLVDTDIDTNRWAYIDSVDKCYDQPWKTKIEINTQLSTIGQQSFTDVLARIAEVANEVKAKQTIYRRASAITNTGTLAAERLEGAINANKIYINGGNSNWYTDDKGNIVFESADGASAMMLSGRGWAISNQKDVYNDWQWRYMATGQGLTADAIYTGYLSAECIEAGSVTTDKLTSTVGQDLDIGSNQAILLCASVDGSRPSGSLETVRMSNAESYIKIAGAENDNPAYIDIQSGGRIYIQGDSQVDIKSGGELNVSGGELNITSQGTLTIDSTNLKVNLDGQGSVQINGEITATSGEIGGYTIDDDCLYTGAISNIDGTGKGVYLGTDGVNIGGKLKYKISDQSLAVDATSILVGKETGTYVKLTPSSIAMNGTADLTLSANSTITISAGNTLSLTTNGSISIGNTSAPFTIGKSSSPAKSYIQSGTRNAFDDTHSAGVYLGTDGISLGRSGTGTEQDPYVIPFRVSQNGHLWATNATIDGSGTFSGSITASSGQIGNWYIASNSLCNASTLADSTVGLRPSSSADTVVFWAGNKTKSSAPFRVYANGNVTLNALTATGANVTGDITSNNVNITGGSISIANGSTTYFSASSSGATIKGTLIADDLKVGGTSIISSDKISLTASTFAGIGTDSSTLQMTNSKLVLRNGSNAITVNSNGISAVGTYVKVQTAGDTSHVNLTSSGIDIKTGSLVINGREFTNENLFARDDIRIVPKNKTAQQIIDEMTGKHDWVLITPIYNAKVVSVYNETYSLGGSPATVQMSKTADGNDSLGNANSYHYKVTGYINDIQTHENNVSLTVTIANNQSLSNSITFTGTISTVGVSAMWFTVESDSISNMCATGTLLYMSVSSNRAFNNVTELKLECTCDAATSRVPASVYYFP